MIAFIKRMKKLMSIFSYDTQNSSAPVIRHTYTHTLALYKSDKDRKPIASVTAKDDSKISVVKLLVIVLCSVCTAIFAAVIIKRIAERIKRKKHRRAEACCECECEFCQQE